MNKKVGKVMVVVVAVVIVLFLVLSFNKKESTFIDYGTSIDKEVAPKRLSVAVSFYPLAEFTKQVVGDAADVVNISGQGISPHDFEPTPKDIASLYEADMFVFNGAGLDPWAKKVKDDLESSGVLVIDMAELLELEDGVGGNVDENIGEAMKNEDCEDEMDCEAQNEFNEQAAESEHAHGTVDPHFWVDPLIARQEVKIIKENLQFIDSENFDLYEKNADDYREKLKDLDEDFEGELENCVIRTVITSHEAFDYLARRYDIEVYSIAGLSPSEEPSAKKLADLAKIAREKKVKYIFFETLASPKLSQTLASEVGAQVLVFNPVAGLTEDEVKLNQDYLSIMRENLNNLKTAMQCQ